MRYSYKGWSDADIAKFQNMLTTQFLPTLIRGTCENGNKELTMAEALINIGVFNDNRAVFEHGVKMWRGRAPAYIYLKSDGAKPVEPAGCGPALWGNKASRRNWWTASYRRRLAIPDTRIWRWQEWWMRPRRHTSREWICMPSRARESWQRSNSRRSILPPNNAKAPENLEFNVHPTWEIVYNHFHDRMGKQLPKMAAVLPGVRPTGVNHHMAWESLTHAGLGSIGLRGK